MRAWSFRWPILLTALVLGAACCWAACSGDDGGSKGQEGEGEGEGEGPDAGVDGSLDSGSDEGPVSLFPDEDFTLVYIGQNRDDPTKPDNLFVVEGLGESALQDLKDREQQLSPDQILPVTANTLHFETLRLNSDHSWMAWTERTAGDITGEIKLWAAPVERDWVINMSAGNKREVHVFRNTENPRDFQFAGGVLVYGKQIGQQVEVMSYDLASGDEHTLSMMGEGGSIRVTAAGDLVVLQEKRGLTGLRLRTVFPVGDATPTLIYEFAVQGATTGSDYTGNERSAISPDGKLFAVLTEARPTEGQPSEFRLNLVSLGRGGSEPGLLAFRKIGAAGPNRCQVMRGPDEYNYSSENPAWSPDGRLLYVLGMSPPSCGTDIAQQVPETDVLRFQVLADGTIGELVNITKNPDADWPIHLSMERMVISPQGKYLAVTGPHGNRYQDRELYVFSTRLPELRQANPDALFRDLRLQLTNNAGILVDGMWLFPSN